VRAAEQIAAEDRILLQAVARDHLGCAAADWPNSSSASILLELLIPRLASRAAKAPRRP
jgi:hypothetical protein